jgi:hypothetical protein
MTAFHALTNEPSCCLWHLLASKQNQDAPCEWVTIFQALNNEALYEHETCACFKMVGFVTCLFFVSH